MREFMIDAHLLQVLPKQACLKQAAVVCPQAPFLWHSGQLLLCQELLKELVLLLQALCLGPAL